MYAGSQVYGGTSGQQQQQQQPGGGYHHYQQPHSGCQSPMSAYPNASSTAQFISSPGGGYIASPPQASFHPNLMSTPAAAAAASVSVSSSYGTPGGGGGYTTQINTQQPAEVQFSGRHNGLYLYLGRLLRPVWAVPLVCGPADQPASQVSGPELEFIVGQLHELRLFLEKHATLAPGTGGHFSINLFPVTSLPLCKVRVPTFLKSVFRIRMD